MTVRWGDLNLCIKCREGASAERGVEDTERHWLRVEELGMGARAKAKGWALNRRQDYASPHMGGRKKGCRGRWGCGEEVEDIPIYWHSLCEMGSKGNTKKND